MMFQLLGDWPVNGGAMLVPNGTVIDGTPTVGAGGSGYAVGDAVTFPNRVVLTVEAVTKGAVTAWKVATPGSVSSGVYAKPIAQVSTSGAGSGATAIDPQWNGIRLPMPMPLTARCLDQPAYDAMVSLYAPQGDQCARLIQYDPSNVKPKGA
ncbi:hypothetical protein E4K64_19150 [Bradyrhizobium frederickii]|uniref:Uncharacterized protein n=1 Tax=Bradyrhizobium frederickii TaxID=2560054 RepID=A0A4Y9P177_9BRAD|nr:hypothetical protein [Bradyrhizobium frederickii]TFV74111.1 hypothetical protein E4K64_19150 [Bradyrhizobium frederickii]